jgi:hypothetical protein
MNDVNPQRSHPRYGLGQDNGRQSVALIEQLTLIATISSE